MCIRDRLSADIHEVLRIKYPILHMSATPSSRHGNQLLCRLPLAFIELLGFAILKLGGTSMRLFIAINFDENTKKNMIAVPVSYTHLDVYKRQILNTTPPR